MYIYLQANESELSSKYILSVILLQNKPIKVHSHFKRIPPNLQQFQKRWVG